MKTASSLAQVAEQYREQITETNLALVLAMAKRLKLNDVDFADLVSEATCAVRSVNKFDCERGFKFSTMPAGRSSSTVVRE